MGRGPSFSSGGGANLSLGAVGGPRGVGAGSIRALINFVTTYDRGALQKLEGDLANLKSQQVSTQQTIAGLLAKRAQLEQQIKVAQQATVLLGKQSQENLKAYTDLQKKATAELQVNGKTTVDTAQELAAAQAKFVSEAVEAKELTKQQATNILAASGYASRLADNQEKLNALAFINRDVQGEINAKLTLQQQLMNRGKQLAGTLNSLLLGAVGGVVGGAVVGGLIFGPLQAGLDAVANFATDIIDPAHKARDAVKDLGEAINGMVSPELPTRLAAAIDAVSKLQGPQKGFTTANPLAVAAQVASSQEALDKAQKYTDELKHGNDLLAEQQRKWADNFIAVDTVNGKLQTVVQTVSDFSQSNNLFVRSLADGKVEAINLDYYLGLGADQLAIWGPEAAAAAQKLQDAADAAKALASYLEDASKTQIDAHLNQTLATINSFSDIALGRLQAAADADIQGITDKFQGSIDQAQANANDRIAKLQQRSQSLGGPSGRTTSLQKQLEALNNTGPSRRTRELADQLERINRATEKQAYLASLAAVAEEKHLTLLKQRLEASKTDIDISKYSGQGRLIAIQAELDLLSRRNAEQQKFNKLLDIQYAISKGVQRTQGESIQDFIGRRAQFYRDQLQQAGELNNQTVADSLNAEKTRVQNEIDLRDLAEKKKKIIADRAHQLLLRRLQNELDASKQADQDALDSRRKQLQTELDASRSADQKALDSQRAAIAKHIDDIRAATDTHVAELNRERDAAIAARQKQYDFDVAKEKAATDNLIAQAKARADAAKQWADVAAANQKAAAISAAQDLATIGAIAGKAAGSSLAYEQLKAELEAFGLTGPELQAALANVLTVRNAAQHRIDELTKSKAAYYGPGYAKGGFFEVTNSMNFGKNIRGGEEGRELGWSDGRLGAILPHKIAESLKGAMGNGAMIAGGVTINRSDDPYRDYHTLKRTITDVVDQRLAAR